MRKDEMMALVPSILEKKGEELCLKLPDAVRNSRREMGKIVKKNPFWFPYASEELKADRSFVLEMVRASGWVLSFLSEDFRADKEIVYEAVRRTGYALMYAAPELRADMEIVFEAFQQAGREFGF